MKNTIKDLCKEAGLSLYALSDLTGIAYNTIHKYANADSIERMPLSTAYKISRALKVDMERLYHTANEIPELSEGWNDLPDSLSVLVEDGRLI